LAAFDPSQPAPVRDLFQRALPRSQPFGSGAREEVAGRGCEYPQTVSETVTGGDGVRRAAWKAQNADLAFAMVPPAGWKARASYTHPQRLGYHDDDQGDCAVVYFGEPTRPAPTPTAVGTGTEG
jgi:hypothetical protein